VYGFIIDHVESLDASTLKASEVSQYLLYLNYVARCMPEMEGTIAPTRKALYQRITALREAKETASFKRNERYKL
jgi:hypothetical protein